MSIKRTLIYYTNAFLMLLHEFRGEPEIAANKITEPIKPGIEFLYPKECERRDREDYKKRFISQLLKNLEAI